MSDDERVSLIRQELVAMLELSYPRIGRSDMIAPDAGLNRKAGQQPCHALPWECNPCRLWSLWDMIRVLMDRYLRAGMHIHNAEVIFGLLASPLPGALAAAFGQQPEPKLGSRRAAAVTVTRIENLDNHPAAKTALADALTDMLALCREINLPTAQRLLKDAVETPPRTNREFQILANSIHYEIESKTFLYLPDYRTKYYESDELLSDKAKVAFPLSYTELRQAGNCLAAALPTACVFHSMRAAEIGVRALATALVVPVKHPIELMEWGVIQDGIDAKIKEIKQLPRTTERDNDQRFYSEAAAQLRYFKDGWRIRVAHARETFNEQQAITVLEHTRAFFETISGRLSE